MQTRLQRPIQRLSLLLLIFQTQTAIGDQPATDWQQRRLMQPSPEEVRWEQSGNIMIYDGLTDRQVALALDGHFPRIETMMFTGTIVTDTQGNPAEDPVTGELIRENDGCD
jgi:hypothetical protein